jgi:hypothetical protein
VLLATRRDMERNMIVLWILGAVILLPLVIIIAFAAVGAWVESCGDPGGVD